MGVDAFDLEARSEVKWGEEEKEGRGQILADDEKLLIMQREMALLRERQKQRGGIIDPEADEKRLHLSNVNRYPPRAR